MEHALAHPVGISTGHGTANPGDMDWPIQMGILLDMMHGLAEARHILAVYRLASQHGLANGSWYIGWPVTMRWWMVAIFVGCTVGMGWQTITIYWLINAPGLLHCMGSLAVQFVKLDGLPGIY
jgi:hypothetical protein